MCQLFGVFTTKHLINPSLTCSACMFLRETAMAQLWLHYLRIMWNWHFLSDVYSRMYNLGCITQAVAPPININIYHCPLTMADDKGTFFLPFHFFLFSAKTPMWFHLRANTTTCTFPATSSMQATHGWKTFLWPDHSHWPLHAPTMSCTKIPSLLGMITLF